MLTKRILQLLLTVCFMTTGVFAQVTTSNLTGTVKAPNGKPLIGATITATHEPTGTVYRTSSRAGGNFDINNLTPGGPYTIQASFVGYEISKKTDVFLNLGEASRQEFEMTDQGNQLTGVTVSTRRPSGSKGGSETNIGRDKIANLPTVGRNINDLVRFTPQVKVTANGGISFAGQNNRYNSFMIDGAVNNDVFGLSEQGTNGGRAGVPPLSLDAIDQIVVQLSPYDASIGNFTGGGINAITRSGTNDFNGSVYAFYRDENFAQKDLKGVKLTEFTNKTFGFRAGGPIVKNKLFYFINAELQDDNRPQPFDTSRYLGNSKTRVGELVNFLRNTYQYDPGDFINNPDFVKRKNINTKLDWNIDSKNKLSLSYRWNDAERTNPARSSTTAINFTNGGEFFPSVTNSATAELNTRFSNNKTNLLRATFTRVVDDRGVVGNPFPNVSIRDGSGTIVFGSEISSTANLLRQNIFNIYDAFRLNTGKHSFTFGTDNDFGSSFNLFINRNFGFYEYDSLGAFLNQAAPRRYRAGYSLVDGKTAGDVNANAAADFSSMRFGLFANDDIKLSDDFTLTLGLRGDYFRFNDTPPVDVFFRDSASKIIAPIYNLEGAETGKMFKPSIQLSPRVGFRYNIRDENVTVRGGIGVFTGRTPLVWPGGLFQQTASTIGAIDTTRAAGLLLNGAPLQFRPDVNNQYTQEDFGLPASLTVPQGELTIVSKDYKVPSVLRTSLAIDKKFADNWTFSVEGIFTKNIQEVDWVNVNLVQPSIQTTGPDKRLIYPSANKLVLRPWSTSPSVRNPYTNIMLLKNTTGKRKGFSYTFTASIDKAFKNGWAFNLNYTYGDAFVNNEGTSSVNSSNWTNMETAKGRNFVELSRSDFSVGNRINTYLSKKFSYAKNTLATTISLVYNGQSGSPFSYTLGPNSMISDGVTNNDLPYIPTSRAELDQMVFLSNTVGGVTYTPAQQRDALWAFIEGDNYLNSRKGQFAERNGDRLPFTNIVDLKLQQDISFAISGKRYSFQLTWDVFNFTNLLNKDWGHQYFLNFDAATLYTFASFSGTTPQYRYTPLASKPGGLSDGINAFNSSRWTSQLGVRFNF